jgi:hypothetical protein
VPAISVKLKYAPGSVRRPFVKLTLAYDMFCGGLAAMSMRTGSIYAEMVALTGSELLTGMKARGTVDADATRAPRTRGRACVNMRGLRVWTGRQESVREGVEEVAIWLDGFIRADAGAEVTLLRRHFVWGRILP